MSTRHIYTLDPNVQEGDVKDYEDIRRVEMKVRLGWTVKIWQTLKSEGDITIPNMSKEGTTITIESVWKDKNGDDWISDSEGIEWDLYQCIIHWC